MSLASVYVANVNLACMYAFALCGRCLNGMCLLSMMCCSVHVVVLWYSEQISLCIGKQGKVREGIKKYGVVIEFFRCRGGGLGPIHNFEALFMGLATLHEPLWVCPHSVGLTKLCWPGYTP